MVENNLTPENFEDSPNSRCGPLTVLIDDLSSSIEKIFNSKIRRLNNWHATTLMGDETKSTKKIFRQKEPEFHSKNVAGNYNNATKDWSLEDRITRASELLTNEIIKILICELQWLSIQKPDDIDLEHWRKILGIEEKNKTAFKEPNITSPQRNFLKFERVGSEARKETSVHTIMKNINTNNTQFRHMAQNQDNGCIVNLLTIIQSYLVATLSVI